MPATVDGQGQGVCIWWWGLVLAGLMEKGGAGAFQGGPPVV